MRTYFKYFKTPITGILLASLLTGCTSTTTIKSTSPHAKIYADGRYLGEGSVSYSDTKVVGSKTVIEIKKDGFQDKAATITRSGQINVGALVGGILLAPTVVGLLFFLWVADYDNYYAFDLEPELAKK